jgi:hypothetical protein
VGDELPEGKSGQRAHSALAVEMVRCRRRNMHPTPPALSDAIIFFVRRCPPRFAGVEADCSEAIFNLGLVNRRMGLHAEALQAFEKLHSLSPSSPEVGGHSVRKKRMRPPLLPFGCLRLCTLTHPTSGPPSRRFSPALSLPLSTPRRSSSTLPRCTTRWATTPPPPSTSPCSSRG